MLRSNRTCRLKSLWKFKIQDVSVNLERPPETEALASSDGLSVSATVEITTLASLPLGGRLIMRCRKDWRLATVVAILPDKITLTVSSPSGHTYRVRRPHDAQLSFDGTIPLLGEGAWRTGLARYDVRW